MKDDRIKTTENLHKILDEAGLPKVPVFEIPHVDLKSAKISQAEARKIQLDAIRQARDGKGKK